MGSMIIRPIAAALLSTAIACAPPRVIASYRGDAVADTVAMQTRSFVLGDAASVDLRLSDGSALVKGSRGDSIRAILVLGPHPDNDYRRECTRSAATAATIAMRRVLNTVEIRLVSRQPLRCAEHWTVEIPERANVLVAGDVAHVNVIGMKGDASGSVDVGNVSITRSGASAQARVRSVGNALAESETSSYAEAKAQADVGRTEMFIDGHVVDLRQAPGPGGHISLIGSGRDRISAQTGVGNASVSVTRKSPLS